MEIEILNESRLHYWCSRIDIPEAAVPELAKVSGIIQQDANLLAIFAAYHEQTALRGEWRSEWTPLPVDPAVAEAFGEQASLFYLLAYLAALPYVEQEYLRRGIGMDVFHDTFLDFRLWMLSYQDVHGCWGYDQFKWIWLHLAVTLFRLGRLQYRLGEFEGGVKAFRQKTSGQILLLADPDILLRKDGYAFGAGKVSGLAGLINLSPSTIAESSETGWRPVFEIHEDGWRGNPVSPYGYGLREEITLPRNGWELILEQGDPILDIHIPRGAAFTVEDCRDSLKQASAFFPQQYPDKVIKAGFCHTWFFTPQLQQLLPRESNIVRFQREFYLYPHAGGPGFLWDFVFGEAYRDPSTAPRDTFLRRAVLDWLARGGELFDLPGVMFHRPDQWGSQPYMSEFKL